MAREKKIIQNVSRIFKTSKRRRHETAFRASSLSSLPARGWEGVKTPRMKRNASVDDRRHLRRMKKTSSKTRKNWIGLLSVVATLACAVVTCAMGWSPFSNREKTTRTERKDAATRRLSRGEKDEAMTRRMKRDEFDEEEEEEENTEEGVEYHTYSIVNSYPHDEKAFTQGFLFHAPTGSAYESTGSVPYGKASDVRRVDIETGAVVEKKTIPKASFGEGLVFMREETKNVKRNSLVQLTWKSSKAYAHKIKDGGDDDSNDVSFEEGDEQTFYTDLRDGWGVTTSTKKDREGIIVISNGTAHLTLFDLNKGQSVGSVTVHDNGVEQRFPNELEAVRGEIWANILEKECVARIDELTGKVLGWIDFTGLKKMQGNVGNVMNGIAYDEQHDRIFITGKQWRRVFEVKISKGSRKKRAIELGRKRCQSPKSLPNYGYP